MAVLVWYQSTFYVTQWIISAWAGYKSNPPATILCLLAMIALLISYRQIFLYGPNPSRLESTPQHQKDPRYPAPRFPRPSGGTQGRLLTVAGGVVVVRWRRGHFTVSLLILLTGFLVLESWLAKLRYSSPTFQGVKRWACTSFKQQCNVSNCKVLILNFDFTKHF